MELTKLFVSGRSATFCLADGGLYHTEKVYDLKLNGKSWGQADTVVTSIYGLWPDTEYHLQVLEDGKVVAEDSFRTEAESFTLDVRRFGAVGDGVHDDTPAIQAAINCCPPKGRVLIPAGRYHVLPICLKSHIRLEIAEGAELLLATDRSRFPILPGVTESTDETRDLYLGSWEGNPLDAYAAMIYAYQAEDVVIYGKGVLEGRAQESDWWVNPKVRRGAWRPRMFFIIDCKDVTVQGVTFRNSPAWHLQPYFSKHMKFLNVSVLAPANSPNTDGFDAESCDDILLAGAHFSLGDDCIALKSGKLYMGAKFATPCSNVDILHCLMENGHGGMTLGSEMAGGMKNITLRNCLMRNTDRGLRVKTRRGRGKDGVIDGILFDNVKMEHVGTPFVVNCMYFCDPDGKSEYVQSREIQPVDERTPRIGKVAFHNVQATDVTCAGYFLGLPEKPIEHVEMENVTISCDPDAQEMQPAMAGGVEWCARKGVVAINVDLITMKNVSITGQDGVKLACEGVGEFVEE
ncbi:MAG: glycoside hydrolase family 28 protein [Clostridia bacterium]|nr:glycoside hydrolase family 28 protein [Clostridia bacterium]